MNTRGMEERRRKRERKGGAVYGGTNDVSGAGKDRSAAMGIGHDAPPANTSRIGGNAR